MIIDFEIRLTVEQYDDLRELLIHAMKGYNAMINKPEVKNTQACVTMEQRVLTAQVIIDHMPESPVEFYYGKQQ